MFLCTLHIKTQDLLQNRAKPITYARLADDLNAQLKVALFTEGWLEQYATDRIKRPDVNKIQPLFEYLSQKQLQLD
jgi:hypothetical protein